jgi:hypothetical protein
MQILVGWLCMDRRYDRVPIHARGFDCQTLTYATARLALDIVRPASSFRKRDELTMMDDGTLSLSLSLSLEPNADKWITPIPRHPLRLPRTDHQHLPPSHSCSNRSTHLFNLPDKSFLSDLHRRPLPARISNRSGCPLQT